MRRAVVPAMRAFARATTAQTRARARPRAIARASSSSEVTRANAGAVTWTFRLLYDGGCPLCVREVDFLRERDGGAGKLSLVDVAADDYDPKENAGIEYETAMATIHGVDAEGRVYTGVEVFRKAYEAVGIGYVYALTKIPAVLNAANAVYDVWAKYRLNVTGRGSLAEHLAARKARLDGKACGVDGSACE